MVNLMYKSSLIIFHLYKFDGNEVEDAFLQETIRENESENKNLSVKNINVRSRMEIGVNFQSIFLKYISKSTFFNKSYR